MEKKELTNDENLRNLKRRKIIRYIILPLYFATIVVALADLFAQQTILLLIAILLFLLTVSLDKYRESIPIIKSDELEDDKEEIENSKEKNKEESIKEEKKEEVKKETKKTTTKKTTKKTTTKKTATKKGTKAKTNSTK